MSDMLRISGLVSGMDTDTTVKKLIQVEQIKIDRAEQEKQYMEWQRDDYREVSNLLRGFQDEYFDVLNSATNMRSASTYDMFAGSATVGGVESTAVSITTSSDSVVSNFSIDSVGQLATKDSYVSGSEVLGNITTGNMDTFANINSFIDTNNKLSFTFDGVTEEIELDQTDYASYADFAADLSAKLQDTFTNVDITAEVVGADQLEFKIYESGSVVTEEPGHTLTVGSENSDLLDAMSLTSGQSNTVDTSKTLVDVFGTVGDSTFNINGTDFTFSDTATISSVIDEINTSSAGVTISYDSFSDKFTLESDSEGTDDIISITDTDGLLADFKLSGGAESYTAALNSEFVVNGVATTRSSNSFEMNGASIKLNEVSATAITIDIVSDTSSAKDLIVKFVDSYNEMISTVNDMTSTRKNYDYEPLTAAQKESMTDDDIEDWQAEARKGTLKGDASLEKITQNLRTAMYESIEGLDISLYDIGITTSANYKDRGKLIIDESKLDTALEEKPNEVIKLFTQESTTEYSDISGRSTRSEENGIVNRMYDILRDNIRLTRDDEGKKGYLIEKAGISTGIDITSDMSKKLFQMDEKIDDLLDMLASQESKYYQQFARMESAMATLTAQGDALASQLGG